MPKALEGLRDIDEVLTENRGPEVDSTWLGVYINPDLETQIAREVETCEILRKSSHPNIASYYGYQETHGRVSALCFKRYKSSLLEAVNLDALLKPLSSYLGEN